MNRSIISALVIVAGASTACAQSGGDARAGSVGAVTLDSALLYPRVQGTSLAARADSLVRAGRPWRATSLLAASLSAPATAPPEVRLVAARAAAAWEGWAEVERVLRDAPWLDQQFDGEGRELLARGALERGADAQADARAALAAARTAPSRTLRGVLLARALDRANLREPAAQEYLNAAARLPAAADWLRLRAAGVTSDSAARWAFLARITDAPARARIAQTDAQARERAGDFVRAAEVYRQARAFGSSFRAEALGARTETARADLARRIIAFLGAPPTSVAEVRQAIETLDQLAITLPRSDELIAARAAADAGLNARSVTGFARAAASAALTPKERFAYAGALSRSGRNPEAARVYSSITDSALAPLAAYQGARAILQSGSTGARDALRTVANNFAATHAAAAPALLLLADLQVDDGDLTGAAASLARIAREHPDAPQAPLARFREGLLKWNQGPPQAAVALFDSLVSRYPRDEEATAARYWAARALERMGNATAAVERFKAIVTAAPTTYYGQLSARRLRLPAWTAPSGSDTVAHIATVDAAANRVRLLQQLGMDVEARFELDALSERAERAPAEAPAIAQALRALGEPARALRIATRALDRAAPSRALYLAAYPVVHADALAAESQRNALDPALVAGLIRQESSWNPRAVSPVGARGLMQLMPSVGAAIASSRSFPLWNQALLFEPDVSLELGTAHLASGLRRGDVTARGLAAYNAGASRVARWARRPDASDPELFTEWIPFVETRDYVRIVQRNAEIYRVLYGLR